MESFKARREVLQVKVMDLNSSWVDHLQYFEEELGTLTVGAMKKRLCSTQKQFDSQSMKMIYKGTFLRSDDALLVDLMSDRGDETSDELNREGVHKSVEDSSMKITIYLLVSKSFPDFHDNDKTGPNNTDKVQLRMDDVSLSSAKEWIKVNSSLGDEQHYMHIFKTVKDYEEMKSSSAQSQITQNEAVVDVVPHAPPLPLLEQPVPGAVVGGGGLVNRLRFMQLNLLVRLTCACLFLFYNRPSMATEKQVAVVSVFFFLYLYLTGALKFLTQYLLLDVLKFTVPALAPPEGAVAPPLANADNADEGRAVDDDGDGNEAEAVPVRAGGRPGPGQVGPDEQRLSLLHRAVVSIYVLSHTGIQVPRQQGLVLDVVSFFVALVGSLFPSWEA
jgi:hypothetical protein